MGSCNWWHSISGNQGNTLKYAHIENNLYLCTNVTYATKFFFFKLIIGALMVSCLKKNLFFGTYLSFERIFPLNVAASPLNREPLRHCIIAEVCTGTSTLSFVYE